MSQRVQKGSTVFRPVARPRPRVGTESRQPSESTQDDNSGSLSSMPPPSVITRNAAAEVHIAAASHDGLPQQRNTSSFQSPSHISASDEGSRVARIASRMPPTIAPSRRTPHDSSAVTIPSSPSLSNSNSHECTPPVPQQSRAPPPSVDGAEENQFHDYQYSHSTRPLHEIDHLSSVPHPIDASNIDPQLMAIIGRTRAPQGIPPMPIEQASVSLQPESTQDSPSTRKRRSSRETVASNEIASEPASKKRRLNVSGSRSGRRRSRPASPPFDADAEPGEELDPTVVTMAALCDDTGRGRISTRAAQIVSNHTVWRAANREKRARLKAVMEAKKYGRNPDDDDDSTTQSTAHVQGAVSEETLEAPEAELVANSAEDESNGEGGRRADGFDYAEDLAVSRYNVQVRIGPNGETIIDEDSLFVSRDEEHRTEDYTHVEESDFTKFVNSGTYSKKARGSRWSAEETELFFDALSQFGENYELISYILPGRDRKACKNKFKSEDKKNPARVTYCLNHRKPYDIATLTRMTGKDFSGPTPEIRAPTPIRSTDLEVKAPPIIPSPLKVRRKRSRTASVRDTDVEILGDIDDFNIGEDLDVNT